MRPSARRGIATEPLWPALSAGAGEGFFLMRSFPKCVSGISSPRCPKLAGWVEPLFPVATRIFRRPLQLNQLGFFPQPAAVSYPAVVIFSRKKRLRPHERVSKYPLVFQKDAASAYPSRADEMALSFERETPLFLLYISQKPCRFPCD
jgi:hypothetical protein